MHLPVTAKADGPDIEDERKDFVRYMICHRLSDPATALKPRICGSTHNTGANVLSNDDPEEYTCVLGRQTKVSKDWR